MGIKCCNWNKISPINIALNRNRCTTQAFGWYYVYRVSQKERHSTTSQFKIWSGDVLSSKFRTWIELHSIWFSSFEDKWLCNTNRLISHFWEYFDERFCNMFYVIVHLQDYLTSDHIKCGDIMHTSICRKPCLIKMILYLASSFGFRWFIWMLWLKVRVSFFVGHPV